MAVTKRMPLGRGTIALAAGLALVMAGSVLAIAEAASNPPPDRVLRDVQRSTAQATSFLYGGDVTIDAPTGQAGQHLVNHRQVTGLDVLKQGFEYRTTEGGTTAEYLSTATVGGVLIRGAGNPVAARQVQWSRYPTLTDFDRVLAASVAGPGSVDTAALQAAILTDSLSNPLELRRLIATASKPTRRGSARHLHVTFDPLTSLPDVATAVAAADGDFVVTSDGRLASFNLTVRAGGATYIGSYLFHGWNQPASLTVPAASDISG
jgi:hypothetical protein